MNLQKRIVYLNTQSFLLAEHSEDEIVASFSEFVESLHFSEDANFSLSICDSSITLEVIKAENTFFTSKPLYLMHHIDLQNKLNALAKQKADLIYVEEANRFVVLYPLTFELDSLSVSKSKIITFAETHFGDEASINLNFDKRFLFVGDEKSDARYMSEKFQTSLFNTSARSHVHLYAEEKSITSFLELAEQLKTAENCLLSIDDLSAAIEIEPLVLEVIESLFANKRLYIVCYTTNSAKSCMRLSKLFRIAFYFRNEALLDANIKSNLQDLKDSAAVMRISDVYKYIQF